MSRFPTAVSGALVLVSLLGCGLEPETVELHHSLNEAELAKVPALSEDPVARELLRGTLDALYGTPEHPGYMRLEAWVDDEYDPNRGDLELSDDEWEALQVDNERAFAQQLAAIDEGRYEDVREPLYAAELWASWQDLLAALPETGPDTPLDPSDEEWTWKDQARWLFTDWYPTLSESASMYRFQCMHCHGTSGGGDGSTAPYLNPRPRDYRQGKFKFTALKDKARPRRADLLRILREGVYTTAMPSFRRFSDAQLNGLSDYVRLLSRRGETEGILISDYDPETGFVLEKVQENYLFVHERWEGTDGKLVAYDGELPEATPERIAHGRELFLGGEGKGANCASCHGVDARGDGASAYERNPETGELELAKDDWGNPIQPRNLRLGIFRFGRRPIDIYRRVYSGINGTPMPEHIGMQVTEEDGTQRPLSEDDLWDIVHFVRSLSDRELVAAPSPAPDAHN